MTHQGAAHPSMIPRGHLKSNMACWKKIPNGWIISKRNSRKAPEFSSRVFLHTHEDIDVDKFSWFQNVGFHPRIWMIGPRVLGVMKQLRVNSDLVSAPFFEQVIKPVAFAAWNFSTTSRGTAPRLRRELRAKCPRRFCRGAKTAG